MPRTRAQRERGPSPPAAAAAPARRPSPPAAATAAPAATATAAAPAAMLKPGGSSAGSSTANVQSSIPSMSIAEIRSIMGDQRRQFQENGYVNVVDMVRPGMTRLEFCHQYQLGVAQRRHQKHKRAVSRQKNLESAS